MDLNNSVGNKIFQAGEVFTGTPSKIKDLSNTIKVAYHGANGVLRIYQSPNGKLWSYYEEFTISGNSFAQSGINGNYYYVKYTNVTGTNTITIATNLSQQIHDNFNVQLDANDTVTVSGLLFNEDGALIVSSTGGGGGLSADVNVTNASLDVNVLNQLDISALATSAKQDSILSDLDTIANAVTGTLTVNVNNPTDVSALATQATQEQIKTQLDKLTFTSDNKLKIIEEPLIITEPAYLDFDNNSAQVIGDSPVGCWYNPVDSAEGWAYQNITAGGGQVYYYTNTGLVPNATEPNITLGSVTSGWCVASYNIITTNENTWIMGVYTKATGSGDAQIWYKSRKSYQVSSSFPLSKGVDYLFYWGVDPTTIHPELQHVEMALASTQGTADPSEIVQFMSLNIPSIVPQYQFVGRVKRAGYVRAGVAREVVFMNSNSVRADLRLNQLKFNTVVEDVGKGALYVNIENETLPVSGTFWQETQPVSISGTVPVSGTFWQTTQPISGSVAVTGDVNVSNFPASQVVTGDVNVSNFPASQAVTGTFWQETQPVSIASSVAVVGDVNVTNMVDVSSLATELTQSDIKTSVDQLKTFLLDSHLEVTNLNNISNYATETTLDSIKLAVQGTLATQVTNPVSISGGVEISNQPTVNLASGSSVSLAYGSQIQLINSEVALVSGTQVNIGNLPSQQSVSVDNTPTVNLAYGSTVQTTNIPGGHLDCYIVNTDQGSTLNVNVQNTPSVSISSGTVSLAYGSQIQLINSEVGLTSGTTVNIGNWPYSQLINGSVSVDNFPAKQSVFIENTTEGFDINTHITNTSLPVSGTVDSHMYANGSGGSMHLVSCDSQGKLNICLHDNLGNGITSTTDGTKQALDVKLSSNPTLSASTSDILVYGFDSTGSANRKLSVDSSGYLNAVVSTTNGTAIGVKSVKYGSWGNVYNNQASILPSAVSSSIDVSNWAYVMGWYQDSTTGSGTGSIYLEYSFDNITFYRIFNTMIVPSGSGTRTANITKQDLGGIKYIRMNNATTQTLTSVSLTLFGASN